MAALGSRIRGGLAAIRPAHTRLGFGVLAALLLGWTALRITAAGNAHRTGLRASRATLAGLDDWRRRFRPAAPAESAAWRRTRLEVLELGVAGDERLALTQAISRAAEAAGLRDVRVRVAPADTTGSEERLSTEGVRRQPAPFSLLVECRGSVQAVVDLVGQLPASVAATTVRLVRQDGVGRHRLTLAVYELALSNASTALGSSAERGNPGDRGDRRIGG